MIPSPFNTMRNVRSYLLGALFAGAMGVTATGCGYKRTDKCIDNIICSAESYDAGHKRDAADANYHGADASPNNYDAERPQRYDSGHRQDDAQPPQPIPECRIDLECPEPLKCLEQKCRSDKDTDFDMILDDVDNCMLVPNPQQEDTDRDGIGNDCYIDEGNDGKIDCEQGFLYAQNRVSDVDDFNIYFFNETHRTITGIIQRGKADIEPAWSPDGVWFAYASDLYGTFDIFVSLLHGRNSQRLRPSNSHRNNERYPAFSPDGEWILYASDRQFARENARKYHVMRMKRDGTEDICLTCISQPNHDFKYPTYMSDGRILVAYKDSDYTEFFEIGILNLDNRENLDNPEYWYIEESVYVSRNLHDPHSPTQNPKFFNVFAFSAVTNGIDIRQVYMCRHGGEFYCADNAEIISLDRTEAEEPAWSADGNSIYYVTKMPDGRKVIVRRDDIFGERPPIADGVGSGFQQINPAPSLPCN